MINTYLIHVIHGDAVERKVVDNDSWHWLYGGVKFTDAMVQDFRHYHADERIGLSEAYQLFTKASGRDYSKQTDRALLLAPSLFKGHFRCGGRNTSYEEVNAFVKRHGFWLWNTHQCKA